MEGSIDFNFIYTSNVLKTKVFLSKIPRGIDCVNYIDIVNKLTKNDYYNFEPSDEVVSSFLVKQLYSIFNKDSLTSVYYVLGSLDKVTISNIKFFIQSISNKEITFNMYCTPDISINGTSSLFNDIIIIE